LHDGALVDGVLVFADGRLVYAGETTSYRWDVSETWGQAGLERAGWTISIAAHELATGGVRVFAVRDLVASELTGAGLRPRPVVSAGVD
jgi:hypothetical protein